MAKKDFRLPKKVLLIYVFIDALFGSLYVLLGAFTNSTTLSPTSLKTAGIIGLLALVTKVRIFWENYGKRYKETR